MLSAARCHPQKQKQLTDTEFRVETNNQKTKMNFNF